MDHKLEKIQEIIARSKEDFEKFYIKGNKSAGTRLRKSMQEIKNIAQEIRVDVQEVKSSL